MTKNKIFTDVTRPYFFVDILNKLIEYIGGNHEIREKTIIENSYKIISLGGTTYKSPYL
jgi:hypothetical protein